MKYWFYRWFMTFAHRHGWHKMEEFYPEGDTMLWCQWCGLRVITKRHLTTHAPDGAVGCAVCGSTNPNVHFTEPHRFTGLPRR